MVSLGSFYNGLDLEDLRDPEQKHNNLERKYSIDMHRLLAGFEFITRGGFMMIPLLLSGLIALTAILERLYLFQKIYNTSEELQEQIFRQIQSKQFSEAIKTCKKIHTPVSCVIQAGLNHFENPMDEMELSMKNEAESWVPRLERRIDILDTVITAAPLMGLLGTITGMMSSFQVLSEKGVNEPNAITGGVAEALIATATGLVIALICLLFYNFLTSKVKGFIYEVESVGSRLVETRLAIQRIDGNKKHP